MEAPKNVFGENVELCCNSPMTGFYRTGFCYTGPDDFGTHIVCAKVTEAFLAYSKSQGNDLITPRPEYNFPGLQAGDKWCLCISRWVEAMEAGYAPPIDLKATHIKALDYVPLDILKKFAL
ncbi:MAG: DUF2237 domain-containing protein [Bacteroidota bacterium]